MTSSSNSPPDPPSQSTSTYCANDVHPTPNSGETSSIRHDSSQAPVTKQSMVTKSTLPSEQEDMVICVMGATGSGKSSFINRVSGSNLAVGQDLLSCTSELESSTFELFGKRVTLIDTPGFDDATKSDTDILKMIAFYLSTTYHTGQKLSGVIYMHCISDFRMTGISRRNFNMFRKLCGDETLRNVVIVTNMWGEVTPEKGAAREAQLRTNDTLFKPAIDEGAQMLRHDDTTASAQAILRHLVDNQPRALQIQRELVDEHMTITQTAAGVELDRALAALRETYDAQLAAIRQEMMEMRQDLRTRKELEDAVKHLEEALDQIRSDRKKLECKYAEDKTKADTELKALVSKLNDLKCGGFFARLGRGLDSLLGIGTQ